MSARSPGPRATRSTRTLAVGPQRDRPRSTPPASGGAARSRAARPPSATRRCGPSRRSTGRTSRSSSSTRSTGLTAQDAHVAGYVVEEGKGLVIAVNKWDLVEDKTDRTFDEYVDLDPPRGAVPRLRAGRLASAPRPASASSGCWSWPWTSGASGASGSPTGELNRLIGRRPSRARRRRPVKAGRPEDLLRDPGGGRAADVRLLRQRRGADPLQLPALPGEPAARRVRLRRHADPARLPQPEHGPGHRPGRGRAEAAGAATARRDDSDPGQVGGDVSLSASDGTSWTSTRSRRTGGNSFTVRPKVVLERPELCDELEDALARLPAMYRAPVVLHDALGWAAREIATTMHVSLPATKQRLRRGRMMLVSALAEDSAKRRASLAQRSAAGGHAGTYPRTWTAGWTLPRSPPWRSILPPARPVRPSTPPSSASAMPSGSSATRTRSWTTPWRPGSAATSPGRSGSRRAAGNRLPAGTPCDGRCGMQGLVEISRDAVLPAAPVGWPTSRERTTEARAGQYGWLLRPQRQGAGGALVSLRRRGVAQLGSAPEWGSGGPAFESRHPDHRSEHERGPRRDPRGLLIPGSDPVLTPVGLTAASATPCPCGRRRAGWPDRLGGRPRLPSSRDRGSVARLPVARGCSVGSWATDRLRAAPAS